MPYAFARFRAALPCAVLMLVALPTVAQAAVMRGTSKADKLIGSAAKDSISARAGADVIDGRAGADRLNGGAGNDRITAGRGDKVAAGRAMTASRSRRRLDFSVACGPGSDRVKVVTATAAPRKAIAKHTSGCETVQTAVDPTLTTADAGTEPGLQPARSASAAAAPPDPAADPDSDADPVADADADADAHPDADAGSGHPGAVGAAGHGVGRRHADEHRRALERVERQRRRRPATGSTATAAVAAPRPPRATP